MIASPSSGYTVTYLRAVVHHAKIYVRPLQQDLSLDPVEDEVKPLLDLPRESCIKCGEKVLVTALKEHIATCKTQLRYI